jgi:hypothetical protein
MHIARIKSQVFFRLLPTLLPRPLLVMIKPAANHG